MATKDEAGPHSVRKELTLSPSVLKAIIKESVQVSLSQTPKWSQNRLDTAEVIIGIKLGYPEASEEYHSAYSAKLANMNIDIQAALISDPDLTNIKWSRGKLAHYIFGILVSGQPEKATSYYETTNLLKILQNQLHDEKSKEFFNGNRFALALIAIAMRKFDMEFERQYEDILTAHSGTYKGIDEAAMITMACTCLDTPTSRPAADVAARFIANEIQKENNALNVYSLGLAAQALVSTKNESYKDDIARAKMGIASKIDISDMKSGLAASQILPALADKSFLDIGIHPLPLSIKSPTPEKDTDIGIVITVDDPIRTRTIRHWNVLLSGSKHPTLLQMMEALENRASSHFSFETTQTSLGPMVTTINGIAGNDNMYWKILLAPDTPLDRGVSDTYPRNGEHYIFRLTELGTH